MPHRFQRVFLYGSVSSPFPSKKQSRHYNGGMFHERTCRVRCAVDIRHRRPFRERKVCKSHQLTRKKSPNSMWEGRGKKPNLERTSTFVAVKNFGKDACHTKEKKV